MGDTESVVEANVDYVVISGSSESDESIDSVCNVIRHSLRTQFPCKKVTITIEEELTEDYLFGSDSGDCYH